MKVRNGFVSNSSSSSFLLLGFKRSEEIEGFEYENSSGDDYFYGETLAYGLEDDTFEIDFASLPEKAKKISEEYSVDLSEIKLFIDSNECYF